MLQNIKSLLYDEKKYFTTLNVVIVTMQCHPEPEKNLIKISDFVKSIKEDHPDVKLIVFGEVITGWYFNFDQTKEYHKKIADEIPGKTTDIISNLASTHSVNISFGMTESKNGRIHSSQVMIDTNGEIASIHRKTNLRGSTFHPGDTLVSISSIGDIKIGTVICYDIQSMEVVKELMRMRLDLIILSLADDDDADFLGAGLLSKLFDSWIVAANRYGTEGGHFWNGWVFISNPLGELCIKEKGKEQYVYHEIGFVREQSYAIRTFRRFYLFSSLIYFIIRNVRAMITFFREP